MRRPVTIAGAGVAGLTAAIQLAREGVPVVVHEKRADVGMRFHGDLQAIENWSTPTDVLQELGRIGIEATFDHHRPESATFFDYRLRAYPVAMPNPPLLVIRRGSMPGTLDHALKAQALAAGVEICFGSRVTEGAPWADIVATGPRRASAIAVGYTFSTTAPPGLSVIFDQAVAPDGYAYLVTAFGVGCLGTVLFRDLRRASDCRRLAFEAFRRVRAFDMENVRPYGGYGQVGYRRSPRTLRVGEAGGFQDSLWGFGMRMAMETGCLAARAILEDRSFERDVNARVLPIMRRCRLNRIVFARLGNRGRALLAASLARSGDVRGLLASLYAPGPFGLTASLRAFLAP